MVFQKEYLDLLLVPSGLCIMFIYHLYLLYRYLNIPHTTIMGFENNDKRAWIERIMQARDSNTINTALNVIGSNNNGATFLASVSLTLASLIGAWMANNSIFNSELIYGDTRPQTMCIKFISLLIFFLLAFACFVQSSRCFIHANYLITIPDTDIPISYVELAVIRGGEFWSLGLRALYFATTLLLWFFGPIPMFITSVVMVFLLHSLDKNTKQLHNHRSYAKGKDRRKKMVFQKEHLDLYLVPSGLLIMIAYHLFLLQRYVKNPHTTVLGFENNDKIAWVQKIMQTENRDVTTALEVLASNNSGATFLATVCLTLSSLIGAWMANSSTLFRSELIYGDTRPVTISIKYISLIIFFLLAFSCFVQSSRCFIHANYLISIPNSEVPASYVELAVIRGGDFWSIGLRALYFAITLLLWFFGPIPMFATSIGMVFLLYYLDTNKSPLLQHYHSSTNHPPLKSLEEML
ncbi:hypothetical protein A4A49_34590 [Nicotiana attenuata]|uniref:Uncharacterized protein n=1 Tax=Nicotiana attenuata TaxID=49451 RepID=A0A1J6IU64_NICAT|nr:hypothetical protein A4A49_34590 [Nicotiana attenuata]